MLAGSSKSFVQASGCKTPKLQRCLGPYCAKGNVIWWNAWLLAVCVQAYCPTYCIHDGGEAQLQSCQLQVPYTSFSEAFKLGAEPGKCGMYKCSLSLFSQSCAAPNATSYSMPASELSLQRPACLSMSDLLNTSALSIAQTLYHPLTCNHNLVLCLHVHPDCCTI